MHDRCRLRKVNHVTESCFEALLFALDQKAPFVNAAQNERVVGQFLKEEGLRIKNQYASPGADQATRNSL